MIGISEIIDDVLGREFEIECSNIVLRGREDSVGPYFSGPGVISGGVDGSFTVTVHDSLQKDSKKFIELVNAARRGLMMCFDAIDYHDCGWTGGWLNPIIQGSNPSRCLVTGNFPQLSAGMPLTQFDKHRNATVIYYAGDLRLPMLEVANIQRTRGGEVEERSTHWDRSQLELDGASVLIREDEAESRTIVSIQHTKEWSAPYCEVGLADAIGFACAVAARPRVTIRYFDDNALLFVRKTPSDSRTGLPRPIAYHGPRDQAFWKLFLAFLRDCKTKSEFDGTPLARVFSELVYASTGTIHVFVLSLVVAVDDLAAQIVGASQPRVGIEELMKHIDQWSGNAELKESAIRLLQSGLSRTSTPQHLQQLETQGVVTTDQVQLWKRLRPKLAHGKLADYEELWNARDHLITMVYRLAARLLGYQGTLTDYTNSPPTEFQFQWKV